MADQPLALRSDADLEAALRAFGEGIAWPEATSATAGLDVAAAVRARIESSPRTLAAARPRWNWWPARRALVVAVLILLVLAAIAGAATLGLPGLRLILGPAPVSAPPSLAPRASSTTGASGASAAAGAPGSTMGLGQLVPLDQLDAEAGFNVAWPQDPALGPPDAAYIDPTLGGQVALVWRSRDGLPDTLEPGVGLVVTAFQGATDSGFYSKAVGSGTKMKSVLVGGHPAFWLHGDPHFLFYEGRDGFIHDPRRWVGDALLWTRGPITYRLETSLGEAAAIRLAESMPAEP
jgi:hypothetical protein